MQWFAWLRRQCAAEKMILRLNLDETSIKLFLPCGRGHIVRLEAGEGRRLKQPASRNQMRSSLTFVAIICDDPSIQTELPQIILGSERALTHGVLRQLRPGLRDNVILLRAKNGWMTAGLMARLMTMLGQKLMPFRDKYQPIMLFDAYPAHLSPWVFRAAARANIWTLVIPAKMTGLMQPLDTHVFYKMKMYLRKRFMEAALQSESGRVSMTTTIMAVNDAVRYILQKYSWKRAFEHNGFSVHEGAVRQRIREAAGLGDVSEWHNDSPLTLKQFQDIWPNSKIIPFADLFAWSQNRPRMRTTRLASQQESEDAYTQEPWLKRLRPRNVHGAAAASSSWQRRPASSRPPVTASPSPERTPRRRVARAIAKSQPSLARSVMTGAAEAETSRRR